MPAPLTLGALPAPSPGTAGTEPLTEPGTSPNPALELGHGPKFGLRAWARPQTWTGLSWHGPKFGLRARAWPQTQPWILGTAPNPTSDPGHGLKLGLGCPGRALGWASVSLGLILPRASVALGLILAAPQFPSE